MAKRLQPREQYLSISDLLYQLQEWETLEDTLKTMGKSKQWYYDLRRTYPKIEEAIKQSIKIGEVYKQAKDNFENTVEEYIIQEITPVYKWWEILVVTLVWIIGAWFIIWAICWYALAIDYLLSLI